MRAMDVQVLLLDEVHNILAGTFREQRIVLNTLRYISNELQISLGLFRRQRRPRGDQRADHEPRARTTWRRFYSYRSDAKPAVPTSPNDQNGPDIRYTISIAGTRRSRVRRLLSAPGTGDVAVQFPDPTAQCTRPGARWSRGGVHPSRILGREARRRCRGTTPSRPSALGWEGRYVRLSGGYGAQATGIFSLIAAILRKPPRDFLISNGSNLADALISRNLRQHDSAARGENTMHDTALRRLSCMALPI